MIVENNLTLSRSPVLDFMKGAPTKAKTRAAPRKQTSFAPKGWQEFILRAHPLIRSHRLLGRAVKIVPHSADVRSVLTYTGTLVNDWATLLYRASKPDCDACELKPRCCPKMPARKVPRSIYENARDVARAIAKIETYVTSRRERKKIEMLFVHLKRILRLYRLWLRGPSGAQDEFLLAATVQNLRKLAKLIPLPVPMPA
jgi:Transposase DDE domain